MIHILIAQFVDLYRGSVSRRFAEAGPVLHTADRHSAAAVVAIDLVAGTKQLLDAAASGGLRPPVEAAGSGAGCAVQNDVDLHGEFPTGGYARCQRVAALKRQSTCLCTYMPPLRRTRDAALSLIPTVVGLSLRVWQPAGSDLYTNRRLADSWEDCCALCREHSRCLGWTHVPSDGACWLKVLSRPCSAPYFVAISVPACNQHPRLLAAGPAGVERVGQGQARTAVWQQPAEGR